MTYPLNTQGVTRALLALGDDEDAVAASLIAAGHKGFRNKDDSCPIARYLTAVMADLASVGVFLDDEDGFVELNGHDLQVDMPDQVYDFVCAFDNGEWPALVQDFDQGIYPELIQEANVDASL